jgi:hypothetical protein
VIKWLEDTKGIVDVREALLSTVVLSMVLILIYGKQVQREHYLPAGKPFFMYNFPPNSVCDYRAIPDLELLY